MEAFTVLTVFALLGMAALGLFMSGIGAIRQARLARRMFKLRYRDEKSGAADGRNSQ